MNGLELKTDAIEEITDLHNGIVGYFKSTVANAVRIGQLLAEVKSNTKHGEYLPWVEKNLPFSERTARHYIKVYKNKERFEALSVSSLKEAYKLMTTPRMLDNGRDDNEGGTEEILSNLKRNHPVSKDYFLKEARQNFNPINKVPCAVCDKYKSLVHAHHNVPLSLQYDAGAEEVNHEYTWLCPNHHTSIHILISFYMRGDKEKSTDLINDFEPQELDKILQIYDNFKESYIEMKRINQEEADNV